MSDVTTIFLIIAVAVVLFEALRQREASPAELTAALVHDIGDVLAPVNHSQLAASIVRPYVRPEVTWVVQMHGLFQQHYYGAHTGVDPDAREVHPEQREREQHDVRPR